MAYNKTRRNKSKRNKSEGGSCGINKNNGSMATMGGKRRNNTRRNKTEGGKRKMAKGASEWNKKVTELYRKMKKEDSSVMFKDALVRASELKKKGQL
jgi:hypothetical protein